METVLHHYWAVMVSTSEMGSEMGSGEEAATGQRKVGP